ncbi:hypothetical protein BDV97DRAFT_399443 [Delphinella strobiligena]|nr:hypothetical protein BDV97DRAFT_399443 [Delphinella strobiligena]
MRTSITPAIVLCLTTSLTTASVISDLSSAASITSRISSALHGANSSFSASETGAARDQPSSTSGSSTSLGPLGSATSLARSHHTKNAGVPEVRIPGMGVEGAVVAGGLVAALFM